MNIDRKILRKRDGHFCRLEIKLANGRLSICGTEGRIEKRSHAKREALDYWRGFFAEERGAIQEMNERTGSRCITPNGAAKHVLQHDGELHGLDVLSEKGDEVLLIVSCGQIRETIAEWFPEAKPLLPWHLNDMHAGCEHQEALKWDNEKLGVPCPTCGYKYGTAWLKRELPAEIVKLAAEVCS